MPKNKLNDIRISDFRERPNIALIQKSATFGIILVFDTCEHVRNVLLIIRGLETLESQIVSLMKSKPSLVVTPPSGSSTPASRLVAMLQVISLGVGMQLLSGPSVLNPSSNKQLVQYMFPTYCCCAAFQVFVCFPTQDLAVFRRHLKKNVLLLSLVNGFEKKIFLPIHRCCHLYLFTIYLCIEIIMKYTYLSLIFIFDSLL